MTARRDPDSLIRAYLDEGPTELPDRSYDAVRAAIDQTRQRLIFGPWTEPGISRFAQIAVAAVAIVIATVVGINLLPSNGQFGGPGPSPSASPTASVAPLPRWAAVSLSAGTYYIEDRAITQASRLIFTVPEGWTSDEAFLYKDRTDPGEVMLVTWVVSHIYGDVCRWQGTLVDVGTTVDELAGALVQRGRTASAPSDVTLAGFPARRVDLTVPADLDLATCDNGVLRYWPDPGPNESGGLCCGRPGHTDAVYIVDVAGNRLVVVARHYPASSAENLVELQGIVDSIQIEP